MLQGLHWKIAEGKWYKWHVCRVPPDAHGKDAQSKARAKDASVKAEAEFCAPTLAPMKK
jgi:hypothetical protein